MKYIKIDDDTYISFNESTKDSTTIIKSELQAQIDMAHQRLLVLPEQATDEELLAWAKEHMPQTDYSVERNNLTSLISKNTSLLEHLK